MTSEDQKLAQYYTELSQRMWKVFPPVLLVMGTLGNCLSIAVLCRKNMRCSNAVTYLLVLSVVDIMVLYTGLLRWWIFYYFNIDIRQLGEAACKIHTWLVYSSLDLSTWLLVALTIERLISVYLPHKVKKHCTLTTSCLSLASIALASFLVNGHLLYGLGTRDYVQGEVTITIACTYLTEEYHRFSQRIWPWIDLCLYSLVPLSIIVVCNIAIVAKVLISRRKTRRIIPSSMLTSHGLVPDQTPRVNRVSSMTAILMVLNLVLLITTAPISGYLIADPYYYPTGSIKVRAQMKLAWAVVNMLQYTNNAINFFLYCLTGSRFREELRALFRLGRRSTVHTHNITNISELHQSRRSGSDRTRTGRPAMDESNDQTLTTALPNLSYLPISTPRMSCSGLHKHLQMTLRIGQQRQKHQPQQNQHVEQHPETLSSFFSIKESPSTGRERVQAKTNWEEVVAMRESSDERIERDSAQRRAGDCSVLNESPLEPKDQPEDFANVVKESPVKKNWRDKGQWTAGNVCFVQDSPSMEKDGYQSERTAGKDHAII